MSPSPGLFSNSYQKPVFWPVPYPGRKGPSYSSSPVTSRPSSRGSGSRGVSDALMKALLCSCPEYPSCNLFFSTARGKTPSPHWCHSLSASSNSICIGVFLMRVRLLCSTEHPFLSWLSFPALSPFYRLRRLASLLSFHTVLYTNTFTFSRKGMPCKATRDSSKKNNRLTRMRPRLDDTVHVSETWGFPWVLFFRKKDFLSLWAFTLWCVLTPKTRRPRGSRIFFSFI